MKRPRIRPSALILASLVSAAEAGSYERPKTFCEDYDRQHVAALVEPAVREANDAVTQALRAGTDPLASVRDTTAWLASHASSAEESAQWTATLERIEQARERQRPGVSNERYPIKVPWFIWNPAMEFGSYWTHLEDRPDWSSCSETLDGAWFTRIRHARAFPTFAEDWLPGWSIDGELELVYATPEKELTRTIAVSPFAGATSWRDAFAIKSGMGRDSWLRVRIHAAAPIGPERRMSAVVSWRRSSGEYDPHEVQLFSLDDGAIVPRPLPFSGELLNRIQPFGGFGRYGALPSVTYQPGIGYSIDDDSIVISGTCPKNPGALRAERDVLCMRLAGLSRSEVLERIAKANRNRRWPLASSGKGSFEDQVDELLKAVRKVTFVP